MFYPRVECP